MGRFNCSYHRRMAILFVPYHLDDHLPALAVPVPERTVVVDVRVDLPDADVWSRLVRLYDHVADQVAASVRGGSFPTVVSGDCTVSIGMAAGLQRAGLDPAVVWVDAHGDIQTLETTDSGYLGGMALRFLLGYRSDATAEPLGLRPLTEGRALLVDARDLDQAEIDYLETSPLRRLPVDGLSAADLPEGPLLLNLDLDTLDPAVLPGLRYPAQGGPDVPALLRAVRTIMDSGRVAAVNIACTWEPGDDVDDGIRERVLSAILTAVQSPPTA